MRPLLPPAGDDGPAGLPPVEFPEFGPMHAVFIDPPGAQQQMGVAVAGIVRGGMDGPLAHHAPPPA